MTAPGPEPALLSLRTHKHTSLITIHWWKCDVRFPSNYTPGSSSLTVFFRVGFSHRQKTWWKLDIFARHGHLSVVISTKSVFRIGCIINLLYHHIWTDNIFSLLKNKQLDITQRQNIFLDIPEVNVVICMI